MIVDKKQFDKYVEMLPDLKKDEVYFVSLSARNKYLTQEERDEFSLGRTEMFSREIARDKEGLYYAMKKLRASLQYRRTNNGKEIPEKAIVVYGNINPSSMLKAYQIFVQEMNHEVGEITSALMNGKEPNFTAILRSNRFLMNSIQKARSRKLLIDIDIDFLKEGSRIDTLDLLKVYLKENKVYYWMIETYSGYHIVIDKLTVPNKLYSFIGAMRDTDNTIKEIEFNKNEMIPIPGTLQAGKLIEFIGGI